MRVRTFLNDTWIFKVHLLWPCEPKQFRDYVRRHCDPKYKNPGDFTAICYTSKPADDNVIIGLKQWRFSNDCRATLCHESFHAAHHILSDRGLELTMATSEAYAYLQESIFFKCLELLQKL